MDTDKGTGKGAVGNGNEGTVSETLVENGKNRVHIECKYCSSRMINAGMCEFVQTQYTLPALEKGDSAQGSKDTEENVTDFWCVDDIYTFENIGFSNTVGKAKYLSCADCDRGPVGWHNLETKKSFVALSRVHHR